MFLLPPQKIRHESITSAHVKKYKVKLVYLDISVTGGNNPKGDIYLSDYSHLQS